RWLGLRKVVTSGPSGSGRQRTIRLLAMSLNSKLSPVQSGPSVNPKPQATCSILASDGTIRSRPAARRSNAVTITSRWAAQPFYRDGATPRALRLPASEEGTMELPTTGVHHITLIGSNREDTIAFYEGVLGMPLVFEQPNLDVPEEVHLYFDPGDGRLITFFVRPSRTADPTPNPEGIGNLHHIAFSVSRAVYTQVTKRLAEHGIRSE